MELMFEFLLIIFGIFLIGTYGADNIFGFIFNTAFIFSKIIVYGIGLLFILMLFMF